jgi:hypothetical protein
VVAGAHPVVVGSGVVGLVVGVGLGVLAGGLGVQGSSGLAVEGLEHLQRTRSSVRNRHSARSAKVLRGDAQQRQVISSTSSGNPCPKGCVSALRTLRLDVPETGVVLSIRVRLEAKSRKKKWCGVG